MVDIVRSPLVTRYERPRRTISLYTWAEPQKLNLIGQDVIYGAPGQVPGYSLPQPRFINFPRGVHEQIERSLAVAGAGTAPFAQTEWPLPVRSKYRFRYEYPYPLTLTPPVMGFAQRDWPNPVRRKYRFQYEYPYPRTLAPAGPAPFARTDWPNPARPQYGNPNQYLAVRDQAAMLPSGTVGGRSSLLLLGVG